MKFKIGNMVKLLDTKKAAGAIKNKTYLIIDIHPNNKDMFLLSISEGKRHVSYNGTNAGWWYHQCVLELVAVIGEQLEFSFMYED